MAEVLLDIDTQFLDRIKKANTELKYMVSSVDRVTSSFKELVQTTSGFNLEIFSRLKANMDSIANTKVSVNMDTSGVDNLASILGDVVHSMNVLSSKKVELFDPQKLYTTNAGLVEAKGNLELIDARIEELTGKYNRMLIDSVPEDFFPTANEFGIFPAKGSEEYERQVDDFIKNKQAKIKAELEALIESKAIAEEELKWAKKTQAERAEYVQKTLDKILKDEKKKADAIKSMYIKTISELGSISAKYDKTEAKNDKGAYDKQLERYMARYKELDSRRQTIEKQFAGYLVGISAEANAKIADIETARIDRRLKKEEEARKKAYYDKVTSPKGALEFASKADTEDDMKLAMDYLMKARGKHSSKDKATIDALTNEYMRLKAAIEDITKIEKNEQTLQPSIRHEYIRLQKELDKVRKSYDKLKETKAYKAGSERSKAQEVDLLVREDDLVNKISVLRKAAGNKLREAHVQYLSEKAQIEIAETERVEAEKLNKIRESYREALDELRKLDKQSRESETLKEKYGDDVDTSIADAEIARKKSHYNDERLRIERDYQKEVSDIAREFEDKRAQDELDLAARNAKKVVEKRKKEELDAQTELDTNPEKAIEFSKTTKSIKAQKEAIDHLKKARENLKRTDFNSEREYKAALNAITTEIEYQTLALEELGEKTEEVNLLSSSMKTMITNMVGLGAIKGYANELVRIRGEFEMQQRSLQVLLRNKDEANRLWAQTVELAVKSPYTTQELVTATKQLAAYRVETDKLHSTTKMLTDLSAGLGVEINRLVLAFGQVKAANFLRGTELRQFSEAGINILDELAERFSKIEGKAVSVSEVFDRISKRKVTFGDVEAVLTDMTSEGGAFYKMQEIQSETVKGMQRNLKDSIDLMYNEMGEMSDGFIKTYYQSLTWMVKNWKDIAEVLVPVVMGLASYKATMISLRAIQIAWNTVIGAGGLLLKAFGSSANYAASQMRWLAVVSKGHPILMLISIVGGLAAGLFGLSKSFDATNESVADSVEIFNKNRNEMHKQAITIQELTKARNELLKIGERSLSQEKELDAITRERAKALGELTIKNQEYAKSLRNAGDDEASISNIIANEESYNDTLAAMLYGIRQVNVEGMADIHEAANTFVGAQAYIIGAIENVNTEILEASTNGWDKIRLEYIKLIKASGGDIEKAYKEFEQYVQGLDYDSYVKAQALALAKSGQLLEGADRNLMEAIHNYFSNKSKYDEYIIASGTEFQELISDVLGHSFSQGIIEGLSAERGSEAFDKAIKSLQRLYEDFINKIGDSLPNIGKDMLADSLGNAFGLADFDWMSYAPKIPMQDWAKGYNDVLEHIIPDKYGKAFSEFSKATEVDKLSDVVSSVKQEIKEAEGTLKSIDILVSKYGQNRSKWPEYIEKSLKNPELPGHLKDLIEAGNNMILPSLGVAVKGSSKKDTRYTDLVRTINDVYSAYDKLTKKFNKENANARLWADYSSTIEGAFKRVGVSLDEVKSKFNNFTTPSDIESALQWVVDFSNNADGIKAATEKISSIRLDQDIQNRDKDIDGLTRQLDEAFSGYELSVELGKLNLPKNFAKDFFNIEVMDLGELRSMVIEHKAKFEGEDGEKEYKDYLKRIDEMEIKEQQDRLKMYSKYAKLAIGERARILLDGYKELMDLEKGFTLTNSIALNKELISEDTKARIETAGTTLMEVLKGTDDEIKSWGITEDQLTRIRAFVAEMNKLKQDAIKGLANEQSDKLNKFDWEKFKETDTFTLLMQDMEHVSNTALNNIISRLESFKDEWKDLPLTELKELISLIEKAKEAASDISVRKAKKALRDSIRTGVKDENGEVITGEDGTPITFGKNIRKGVSNAQNALVEAEEAIALLERELSLVEQIETMRFEGVDTKEIVVSLTSQQLYGEQEIADAVNKTSKSEGKVSDSIKKAIKNKKNMVKAATGVLDAVDDTSDAYNKQREKLNNVKTTADALFKAWGDINDLFGEGTLSSEILNLSQGIFDSVINTILLKQETFLATFAAEGFGAAMKSAMGPIGWIVMAVESVVAILKFAFAQHDKVIQGQIDSELEAIEKLKDEYEQLEKQIENAFSAMKLSSLISEANDNLQEQIDRTKHMISLEESRKDSDEEQIKSWKDEIKSLNEDIAENLSDAFSTATDGVIDSVLDATRTFVDSWHEAFNETGDGLAGIEESFDELFSNIIKQQASMTVLGPYINKIKGEIEKYVNAERGDLVLDEREASALRETFDSMKDDMNASLEAYMSAMEGFMESPSSLSGLSKGIQGITEDQAEVLAAYWNTCRFMLANIDTNVARIASSNLDTRSTDNPTLAELEKHTALLETIEDLFRSVIGTGGSSHNGSYIKVHM